MATSKAKKVTTYTNGIPHTTTVGGNSGRPDTTATSSGSSSSSSKVQAPGFVNGVDTIRAPGDTHGQNKLAGIFAPDEPTGLDKTSPTGIDKPQGTTGAEMPSTDPNQTGQVSYEQAQKNLATGGLQGSQLASAQTSLAGAYGKPNPFADAHANLQAGGPAPSNAGTALSQVYSATNIPPETPPSVITATESPQIQTLMKGIADLLNPKNQGTTLLQDYKKLQKSSGLDEINEEIIDAETIINGTEDDIRNEVQAAGGLGTDSQIQAMALSRNKSLLVRYNQLVQMKTDATNQLNTMSTLNAQDKQMAQTKVTSQINAMFQMATFQQQADNNTREAFNRMQENLGYSGIYAQYKNDPKQLAAIEKIMGMPPGGLAQAAAAPDLKRQLMQEQINAARRVNTPNLQFISGTANQPAGTFNPATGVFTPITADKGTDIQQLAVQKGNIDLLTGLTTASGIKGAVGTSALSRSSGTWGDVAARGFTGAAAGAAAGGAAGTFFGGIGAIPGAIVGGALGAITNIAAGSKQNLTGEKQDAIAGIQQVTSQLTLDKLKEAKANGTTFGSLTEGERAEVGTAATKIAAWAVKDSSGNVIGYNATEKSMRKELDRIAAFAKLDYVLKGGDADSVGVVPQPDGSWWVVNSDGSYTQINAR